METLFHILISNAVVAAVPAVLALASARLLKRPALTHALWLLVLLKLLTPPVVDVPVRVLPIDRRAAVTPAPPAHAFRAGGGAATDRTAPAAWDESTGASDPAAIPLTPPSAGAVFSWQGITCGVWIAGACLALGLTAVRLSRFNRLLALASPAPREVQAQADQTARHLGAARSPAVCLVPGAVSPMLWAVGARPRLLLPAALWDRLDARQRAALLAHELAHFRRRDHWVRYLELAASVVYWWHPLVWVSRRELRAAEEQCCDAWVVQALPGHARSYATALLDTVDFISDAGALGGGTVPHSASGAVGAADLKRRLVMIMSAANPKSLSSLGRIAVLALGLVLLPAVPKLASAEDAPKPREGARDAEPPREGARDGERPREGARDGERPREGGDRPRDGERAALPVEASGAGTFVRIERGAILLSDDANDKDVRIGVKEGSKVTVDGRAATFRDLRPGMAVKAATTDGVTTLEATQPRWLKTLNPPGREGDRSRDPGRAREGADRPRGDAERPREGAERPRGDAERPREGPRRERGAGEADRPREEPRRERAPAEADRPREEPRRERGAEGDATPAGKSIRGVFDKLDGTSIVLAIGEAGATRVVPTDDNTKVTVNGQPAKLADVAAGMYVEVKQVGGLTTEVAARPGRR